MESKQKLHLGMKVSLITVVVNIILSLFKLFAGIVANSGAMISDAVHSASDVFSTFAVMIGLKVASKDSDKGHPYGHERMECVAAILLATLLCIVGGGIGYAGIVKVVSKDYGDLAVPGVLALVAAVVSVAVKEGMYWYTRYAAKKINSSALMADAWHHRSDSLSSVGSFIGIFGARLGFPILDPIASIIICIFILKASIDIFKDAINKMTDKACDDDLQKEMIAAISQVDGVLAIDQLKTRIFGDKAYVDIEIMADADLTLRESHDIAQHVHDLVEENFPVIKHCMVHVNPFETNE